MNYRKTIIASVISATLVGISVPVRADVVNLSWNGLFTLLYPDGSHALINNSTPYYYDATWGYGFRTQVSGTMRFDTFTGAGTGTINGFDYFNAGPFITHDITLQAIGDGMGGQGTLILENMLVDWNSGSDFSINLVLDAAGLFAALPTMISGDTINQAVCAVAGSNCAAAASDGIQQGGNYYPMGAIPIATATYNVNNAGTAIGGGTYSGYPNDKIYAANDAIAGSPMDNGPFMGFNASFDMLSVTLVDVNPVPVPAAVWLFGSGLLGLFGISFRQKYIHIN
jgi:hypothetical protein